MRVTTRNMLAENVQGVVALLLDGKPKQAVAAWNALQAEPQLKVIRLGADGESLTLVPVKGAPLVTTVDAVIAELEGLLMAQKAGAKS